jgi:hypothetical protein
MTADPARVTAVGYTVVLPPGWRKIPARQGTGKAIKKILDGAFGRLPPDTPAEVAAPWRRELEDRLGSAARQARRGGAIDLYLPVEFAHGTVTAASFLVSEGSLGSVEQVDPAHIVTYMAAGNERYRAVMVDGAAGVRCEHVAPPDPAGGIDYGSRRVDYTLSVPGEADRWLVIAFSTLGGGDPGDRYARLLVELFDAIMSTFRWQRG